MGVGSIAWILNLYIESAVRGQLETATNQYTRQLQFETAYQEFISLSLSVVDDEEEFIRPSVLEGVTELLRDIAESPESLEARVSFSSHLERLVVALASANVDSSIDEIDDLFRETLLLNPTSLEQLTVHYGQRVLSSALPIDEQPPSVVAKLRDYTVSAKERGYPEHYVLWQALLSFQRNDFATNEVTDELMKEGERLEEPDSDNLYQWLSIFSDPNNYMKEVSQDGIRLAEKVNRLVASYPQLQDGIAAAGRRTDELPLGEAAPALAGRAPTGESVQSAEAYLAEALRERAAGWTVVGTMTGYLGPGAFETRSIEGEFVATQEYRLLGACDESCLDVDLAVLLNGSVVGRDDEPDDVPDVSFVADSATTPAVEIGMFDCDAPTCGYAIAVLRRE